MMSILRLLSCAGALALAGYMAAVAEPDWLAHLAPDVQSLPEVRIDLDQELAFGRLLEKERATVLARTEAKHEMLMDLIDERLTLVETATRYQELDQGLNERQLERLRVIWPGSCQVERYCHQLIQVAEWELDEQPEKAAAVVARLKAEFLAAAEFGAFCSSD
jgi:hypothetical protein